MTDCVEIDRELTKLNRERLLQNRNLILWYEKLFKRMFESIGDITSKNILEIGSGTSPLKFFYPNVLTSDVLELDYLDYIFDCHNIDEFTQIPDASLDVIVMTNVLHHLAAPLQFLVKAAKKLKPGGKIVMTEPYFSMVSSLIYSHIHPEPVSFNIAEPVLGEIKGPLTSANIALPYLIFFSDMRWHERLCADYDFSVQSLKNFTSLAYMVTGGISRCFSVPVPIFRVVLAVDMFLADVFPKVCSSFFIMELTKR